MAMENEQKGLVDLRILKAEELPERVRLENDLYKGFVEVRFEINSPIEPKIISLENESPALRMREAFEKANLLNLFDE